MARSKPIMKILGDVNGASPKKAKPIPPLMPIVAWVMAVSTFSLSFFKDLARNRTTGPGVVTPSLAVGRHWCAMQPTRTWLRLAWHADLKETSPRDRHIAGCKSSLGLKWLQNGSWHQTNWKTWRLYLHVGWFQITTKWEMRVSTSSFRTWFLQRSHDISL